MFYVDRNSNYSMEIAQFGTHLSWYTWRVVVSVILYINKLQTSNTRTRQGLTWAFVVSPNHEVETMVAVKCLDFLVNEPPRGKTNNVVFE